jgi:hypothetical protein
MKIKLCSPFYNETLIAGINIAESLKWVDEIHITECNKSFKYTPHDYCFDELVNPKVFYHQLDGLKAYQSPRKYIPHIEIPPVSRWLKNYCFDTAWRNDAVSRNNSLWGSDYEDNDIVILSDIDEIVDSQFADSLIENAKKYGIVTINIYFTMFYFNLFCPEWSGPIDYSYRIFAVKGDVMRNRFYNDSDYLRKMGESGKLLSEVKCLDGFKGYHHSWLGDEKFILNKLSSYAHAMDNHDSSIFTDGQLDIKKIKEHFIAGKSIFSGIDLYKDDTISLLPSVEKLREDKPECFIK